MALYARSDLMSTSIPVTSGGCGKSHSRPVTHGAPARVWKLECDPCEAYLRGDKKPKIIRTTGGDKEKGIAPTLNHVPDADPHWSNTPEGIPLTPDEQHLYRLRTEQGRQQLDMLQAYAALSKVPGLNLKDFAEAQWMLDRVLDPITRPVISGSVLCGTGHENPSGARFCTECGLPMNGKTAIEAALTEPEPPVVADAEDIFPLHSLHVATLRKMAREKKLDDKGTKAQLIERLSR